MEILGFVALLTVLGVALWNLGRSGVRGIRYARWVRRALDARRSDLPEHPEALADGVPGAAIAVKGRLRVDEGCVPFLPESTSKALSAPNLGVVALSARELDGVQEVVAGAGARLVVGDRELALLPSDEAGEVTRLVVGTFQTQSYDTSRWTASLVSYLALCDGDEVWVVGQLVREVDPDGGADYRGEPRMRYALQEPLSFYAEGRLDVRFRWLALSTGDLVLGGLLGALVAIVILNLS